MYNLYSNVYSCALQRWAMYASSANTGDKERAENEKQTAFMALALASKFSLKNV